MAYKTKGMVSIMTLFGGRFGAEKVYKLYAIMVELETMHQ